jgi:hypothetical protein
MVEHLDLERARHRHKVACRRWKEGERLMHEDRNGVLLKRAVQEDVAKEKSVSHPDPNAGTAPPTKKKESYEYYGDAKLFPGWELVKEH